MFRNAIPTTPLCNEIANECFKNIFGNSFQGDTTFISSLRALVAPRMKDDESVFIEFSSSNYSESRISSRSPKDLIRALVDVDYLEAGTGVVHNLYGDNKANQAALQVIRENFTQCFPDWVMVEKVEGFFRKTFTAICFINTENRNFVIFVDNMDMRRQHYLQCGIFAFMPWYFNPEKGASDQEMELIKSLREKTSENYEKCIAAIANKYNFREIRIKKLLDGFETKCERAEIQQLKNSIESVVYEIKRCNDKIGSYLRQKNDYDTKLLGLQAKIANSTENSEIMEYFLCNKNVILEDITDSSMTFSTTGDVIYFDEDEAENVIQNPDSYIYHPEGRDCEDIIPAEDMKSLMTAIFIDRKLKIKFCSAYTLRLYGSVDGLSEHDYPGVEFKNYTPNPHIDRYSCMGNYQQIINELLIDHNYIGAIEQCMASTASLNFSDSTVMDEFMKRIYGIGRRRVNIRCIELPDGRVVEPKEAIEYLKSQNKQEDEDNG